MTTTDTAQQSKTKDARGEWFAAATVGAMKVEDSAAEKSMPKLSGYCMCWNQLSDDRGGYKYRLAPGSAHPTASCRAIIEHQRDMFCLMGSTDNGTLVMEPDDYGMKFTITPPDTTAARDAIGLIKHMKNAQASAIGMSFHMLDDGKEYTEVMEGGTLVRQVTNFAYDEISVLSQPAFEGTSIDAEFRKTATADKAAAPDLRELDELEIRLQELRMKRAGWLSNI